MEESVTVVVPVYNGELTLPELADRLGGALASADEVIFVEDVGQDASWSVIESIVAAHPRWRGIQLGANSGQHAALLAGIRAACNPVIVTIDDDLQHRPEDIPLLRKALATDVDLVYATPRAEEHGPGRSFASRLVKRLLGSSLHVEHADLIGAFRCFRTRLRDGFTFVDDPYVSIDVLLSWCTSRVTSVTVDMDRRAAGVSGYTFRRLVRHTVNMVTGYSARPLRLVAYTGLALGMLGAGSLIYVLVRYALGQAGVPGFTFLAALLSLLGGIQMIAIAIIGEYLGRIHFRTMRRPSYFVRGEIGARAVRDPHE